jgi:hypothetical protein
MSPSDIYHWLTTGGALLSLLLLLVFCSTAEVTVCRQFRVCFYDQQARLIAIPDLLKYHASTTADDLNVCAAS